MIRKISLLLVFIMLSSVCTAYAADADWTDDERIAMLLGEHAQKENMQVDIVQKLLHQLGIIPDPKEIKTDAKVSTGDFLKAIAEISGAASAESSTEHIYQQLKQGGYINLTSSGSYITMDNALYTAVKLTNRTRDAETHGKYPYGYYYVAKQIKLLDNLVYNGNARLTNAEAMQLYYNILSADKRSLSEVDSKGEHYSDKNTERILEEKYHVSLKKGILTAAYITGMYGPSNLKEHEIEIDRVVYDYAGDISDICVGMRVAAFVQKAEGEERGSVLCFEAYKSEITEFRSADVDEYTDDSITLGKQCLTYERPRIIFNGTYYGILEGSMEEFLELDSQITAVDNNNDGDIDVFNIVGYEHFVTEFSVGVMGVAVFKHDAKFNGDNSIVLLSDSKMYVEIMKDGKPIEPEEIAANSVLSLAMSGNKSGKKYLKVKVSSNKISGTVEEIDKDETVTHLTVNGKSYRFLTKSAGSEPKVGKKYTFLLSASGDIVDLTEESSGGLQWAYLVKYDAGKGLSESGTLKLFTQDGKMEMLNIAESAKYFDEANQNGIKLNGKEIVNKLVAGGISKTLVRYMQNEAGEIKELYLPIDNTDGHMEVDSYPCLYSKNVINGRYYNMKFLISGGWFMEGNGIVFAVPDETNERDELYRVTTLDKEGSNKSYSVQLYDADRFGICTVAVMKATEQSMDDHFMPRVIEKITRATGSEGEDIIKLHVRNANGIVDAGEADKDIISVYDEEMLSYDNGKGWIKNVAAKDLKFGDIISVAIDKTGRMSQFKLLFRASDPGSFRMQDVNGTSVTDGSENIDSIGSYFAYATLVGQGSSASGNSYIKYNAGTASAPNLYINYVKTIYGTGVIYKIETGKEKVTKISQGDLRTGDKIAVYRSWGGLNLVAVIE